MFLRYYVSVFVMYLQVVYSYCVVSAGVEFCFYFGAMLASVESHVLCLWCFVSVLWCYVYGLLWYGATAAMCFVMLSEHFVMYLWVDYYYYCVVSASTEFCFILVLCFVLESCILCLWCFVSVMWRTSKWSIFIIMYGLREHGVLFLF